MSTSNADSPPPRWAPARGGSRRSYLYSLLSVAGMGGLLAGIDYGIIAGGKHPLLS